MLKLATSKILRPFDHVMLCDMEMVLLYKNYKKRFFDEDVTEWYVKDEYGNKIGVSEKNLYLIPVQAYDNNVPMKEPAFFMERGNKQIRINNRYLVESIYLGQTNGDVTFKNKMWHWNIEDLTIKNQDETWLLRVFTMGGWWL